MTKFRNIVDSGEVTVEQDVTCLVGKNEAGKSGLIEALYLLNPAYGEKFQHEKQYPRWLAVRDRKAGSLLEQQAIQATFELEPAELASVAERFGEGVLKSVEVVAARNYGGSLSWQIDVDESAALAACILGFATAIKAEVSGVEDIRRLIERLDDLKSSEDPPCDAAEIAAAHRALSGVGLVDGSLREKVSSALESLLPKFFLFAEYSTLPGRVDFQTLAEAEEEGPARTALQTARALLSLAGTDAKQLGEEDYELRRGELEAVQRELSEQVFEYWKQNPNLEVLIDVDKETKRQLNGTQAVARYLDIRLKDRRTGYSNNFSQRSSGFQWFFSFLAAFSEFETTAMPVVLLDEPALSLHGKAQSDFLRFINERLAPATKVIYTTHSPFMVEAGRLERVRIVEDHGPPRGAVATADVLVSDPDSLFPLQAALGYDIAQSLFLGPHNLVVEGTSEFIFLTILSMRCGAAGLATLDDRWRLLPAGGATNIPTFVSLVGPHLDVTVLADSDTKGMQKVTNLVAKGMLQQHRLILVNTAIDVSNADIEDVFTPEDYLKLYNATFQTSLTASSLPAGDRITKRIERAAGAEYNHGKVAEHLLREQAQVHFEQQTLERFANLIEMLNATIGQ